MSLPEIGGTAHTTTVDGPHPPSPAEITAFADAIRRALGVEGVVESHTPSDGYRWTWVRRGVWTLAVGGILTTEPVLRGPSGVWKLHNTAITQADLVVMMLRLAEALPAQGDTARPPASGVYGVARAVNGPARADTRPPVPEVVAPRLHPLGALVDRVELTPRGPVHEGIQPVWLPSGRPGMVDLRQECRLVDYLNGGPVVIVVAAPPADRDERDEIPAVLYRPESGGPFTCQAPPVAAVQPPPVREIPPAAGSEFPPRGAGVIEQAYGPVPA